MRDSTESTKNNQKAIDFWISRTKSLDHLSLFPSILHYHLRYYIWITSLEPAP